MQSISSFIIHSMISIVNFYTSKNIFFLQNDPFHICIKQITHRPNTFDNILIFRGEEEILSKKYKQNIFYQQA